MSRRRIAVYGAGGFAREVAWLVESCRDDRCRYEPACFIDDDESRWGTVLNGIPVVGLQEAAAEYADAQVVLAVGNPRTREVLAAKAANAGFGFATLGHPGVERSRWIQYGEGTVVCAGSILTVNIRLGRHVQINLDCTVGHDVVMGAGACVTKSIESGTWGGARPKSQRRPKGFMNMDRRSRPPLERRRTDFQPGFTPWWKTGSLLFTT